MNNPNKTWNANKVDVQGVVAEIPTNITLRSGTPKTLLIIKDKKDAYITVNCYKNQAIQARALQKGDKVFVAAWRNEREEIVANNVIPDESVKKVLNQIKKSSEYKSNVKEEMGARGYIQMLTKQIRSTLWAYSWIRKETSHLFGQTIGKTFYSFDAATAMRTEVLDPM